jgi:MFS transporter, DHA1 family, inner membrane transport protein
MTVRPAARDEVTPTFPVRHSAVAVAALGVAAFLYVTTETLPVGLLAPIGTDLGASPARVGLLVTWYGLVVVVASIPLTYLTRRVPRRLLLCVLLGVYVASSLGAAFTANYGELLGIRIATAASQAIFWSVVVPIAASLVPESMRGRAVAVVFGGSSLAAVVGVPLGTYLGQSLGWRWAFVALAGLGAVILAAVAAWIPTAGSELLASHPGVHRDWRRYWAFLAVTVLVTTGAFTLFTYLSPYVTEVLGLSLASLGGVLLLRGLLGLGGVAIAGRLVERRPRVAIALPVAVQVVALALLLPSGDDVFPAITLIGITGFTFAAFTTPLSTRVMEFAPVRIDLALSGVSTAVNVGITLGALIGSGLVEAPGIRSLAPVAAALTAVGLALLVLDRPRTSG